MRTEGHLGQAGKDLDCQVEKRDSMLRQWEASEALEGGECSDGPISGLGSLAESQALDQPSIALHPRKPSLNVETSKAHTGPEGANPSFPPSTPQGSAAESTWALESKKTWVRIPTQL